MLEAFGPDGQTVADLVAWPLAHPEHVMTMFGRCGLLGVWEALGPATYFMGGALNLYRTPLDWLREGCRGAAIVVPSIAAQQLVDAPGFIAAQDHRHGRELVQLLQAVIDPSRRSSCPLKTESLPHEPAQRPTRRL